MTPCDPKSIKGSDLDIIQVQFNCLGGTDFNFKIVPVSRSDCRVTPNAGGCEVKYPIAYLSISKSVLMNSEILS